MTLQPHDCTWYWVGGSARGEWRQAGPGSEARLRRMGYYATPGYQRRRPQDPPGPNALMAVLTAARPV
jgi:hypothetical protein